MKEKLKELLEIKENENRKIDPYQDSSSYFANLNHIIELKNQLRNMGYNFEIYSDLKRAIKLYFTVIENKRFGYDTFKFDKIVEKIKYTPIAHQIELLYYLKRLLIFNEYEELIIVCDKEINRTKISSLLEELSVIKFRSYQNLFRILFLWSSLSISNLLISMFIFFVLTYIVFLPAPFRFMEVMEISYENYSKNFLVNHGMNILSMLFKLDLKMQIVKANSIGLLVIIVGKVFYIILIINYIVKERDEFFAGM